MKIYNEVTSIFNETTGKWETISEDSFEWNRDIMLMQEDPFAGYSDVNADGIINQADVDLSAQPGQIAAGSSVPANATSIDNSQDKIIETLKTTTGYFTGGDGTLSGKNIYTGSLADSNEKYYYNITQTSPSASTAETQFSVAYGHIAGSGSDCRGGTANPGTLKGQSEAIYEQFTSLLLSSNEISGGFRISQQGSNGVKSSGQTDDDVYILIGKRARFKDRLNKKSWTVTLTGNYEGSSEINSLTRHFTDDSATVASTTTPAGPRYNIVSGSAGTVSGSGAIADKTYGWIYPEMGILIWSGAELSASIPGPSSSNNIIPEFVSAPGAGTDNAITGSGFNSNLGNDGDKKNALRFVNCLRNVGDSTAIRFRSEEDQTQINYFCRLKSGQYNHSNNPTFVSGSKNEIRNTDMRGNPTSFISGIGLYNAVGQLVAVAKVSSPIKKNFASEATIKVKLTY